MVKLPEQQIMQMKAAEFGTLLGHFKGVPAYSCNYASFNVLRHLEFPNFLSHRKGKLYYGMKFQCVEYSRRFLIHAYGVTFGDVGMAYEIFDLPFASRIRDSAEIPFINIENGGKQKPVPGAVLIWEEGGEFRHTGHVAIVAEVSDEWVRVAEQNVDDSIWPIGRNYSRELKVKYDSKTGSYLILEDWGKLGGKIKGWKLLPSDYIPEPISV